MNDTDPSIHSGAPCGPDSPHSYGVTACSRYRTVPRAEIIDILVLRGWAYEALDDREQARRDAAQALDRWIGQGLPFERDANSEPVFDPAETFNFGVWRGIHHQDPFWPQRMVCQNRRQVSEFDTEARCGKRFEISVQRDCNLAGHAPGSRVRLRLPLPLEDEMLHELVVADASCDDPQAELTRRPGRFDARLTVPSSGTARLAVRFSFEALAYRADRDSPAASLDSSERELYTRASEGLVQISPRISALAAQLASDSADAAAAVRAFWEFLHRRITLGMLRYADLERPDPTDWALETGWANCHLASALLVTLCRARGIPARVVAGYLIYSTPTPHYWTEIWLEARGWVPFDTLSLDLRGHEQEERWRDCFFGRLDYRMKLQCLPRLFDANPDLRFPAAWHQLGRCIAGGTETRFVDCQSGQLIYREQVAVLGETRAPGAGHMETGKDSIRDPAHAPAKNR